MLLRVSHSAARSRAVFIAFMLIAFAQSSLAVQYCVSTNSELVDALAAAAASNADDEIRLTQGSFSVSADQDLVVRGGLRLTGAWTPGCLLRGIGTTTLAGTPARQRQLSFDLGNGDLLLERIQFTALRRVSIGQNGITNAVRGDIVVRRCRFVDGDSGLRVSLADHNLRIENNVFVNNNGSASGLSGRNLAIVGSQNGPDLEVDILFNTIVNGRFGVDVFGRESTALRFQNNVLRGASSADLLLNQTQLFASHNMIGTRQLDNGATLSTDVLNLSTDPLLDANFQLGTGSAAINSGTTFVFGGVPATDLAGATRVIGSAPDRGAFESAVNDSPVLMVTNTSDSGTGSLRQAIINANSEPGFSEIQFNIPGACPHTITVNSVLPSLVQEGAVNGYSEPESRESEAFDVFDGNICIYLRGNNSIITGLHVQPPANTSILVKGLGFYGFNQQAILVDGAGQGRVHGNLFGTGLPLLGQNFANSVIRINGASNSEIGGSDPALRNVIGGGDLHGIVIDAGDRHKIINNFIGQGRTGVALRNGTGLRINAGDLHRIENNSIGFNLGSGILISNSAQPATQVQMNFNRIGITANALPAGNGGDGIRIDAGTQHSVFRNTVVNNGADGLEIATAARRNRATRNTFFNNQQMAVDLLPVGVNPIDLDVGQSGANDLQNAPRVLSAAGGNSQGEVELQFESDNGSFQIDVYGNDAGCQTNANGHTQAQRFLKTLTLTLTCATGNANCSVTRKFAIDNAELGAQSLVALGITALARDPDGNTSELSSTCATYQQNGNIFRDGFE